MPDTESTERHGVMVPPDSKVRHAPSGIWSWVRRERVSVPLLALIATYAFFCEYLPPFKRVHVFSDMEVFHYQLQRYAFQALHEGRIPQWDPSMYCGISFLGNVQAALFYPPTWLLYAANWGRPILPFKALEDFAFLHIWLAFLLCYVWLRARRLDWFASALGSGVFAFGGYMLWTIVHVGVLTAMPWMPLAFWGIDQSVERREWRPLWKTAVASALWFLSGYPPSWAAFCITVLAYALASRGRWRTAAGVALALLASALLAMVQMLPMIEAQMSMFATARYWREARSAIVPLFVANWENLNRSSPRSYLDVMYLYWGLAAIFALGWAIRRHRIRPYAQPLAVMAVGFFLIFDPKAVVYWTIVRIPVLENALQAYNFFEGVSAMAALITAIGISDFFAAGARRPAPRWLLYLAIPAMALWCARQISIWAHGGSFPTGWRAVAATAIALALLTLALWTCRAESGGRRLSLAVAVILFAFCDYKVYGTNRLINTRDGDVDNTYNPHGIRGIDETAYQTMWTNRQFRVTSDGAPGAVDFRMWGLATPQGLDPLLPKSYRQMILPWARFSTSRVFFMDYKNDQALQTLGVRYAIAYRGSPSASILAQNPEFQLVGQDDSFYRVYEYRQARPPYGWDGTPGEVHPTGWLPECRTFQVRSANGGRFGFAEQFLPGWSAAVDGLPVPIARWREVFQSIWVPAGGHTVVFEYHSRFLPLGAAVSLAAVAALLWMILRPASLNRAP